MGTVNLGLLVDGNLYLRGKIDSEGAIRDHLVENPSIEVGYGVENGDNFVVYDPQEWKEEDSNLEVLVEYVSTENDPRIPFVEEALDEQKEEIVEHGDKKTELKLMIDEDNQDAFVMQQEHEKVASELLDVTKSIYRLPQGFDDTVTVFEYGSTRAYHNTSEGEFMTTSYSQVTEERDFAELLEEMDPAVTTQLTEFQDELA